MAEGEDSEREVLTSLPRSRAVRRSPKRGEREGTDAPKATPAKAAPPPAAEETSAKAPPAERAEAAPKVHAEAATKQRPKPSSKERPKPASKQRPKPASKQRAATKAAAKPRTRGAQTPRVAPERKVPPAGYAAPASGDGDSSPGATEILVTAVQAATELTQIAISVGRQALQSALERLPKP